MRRAAVGATGALLLAACGGGGTSTSASVLRNAPKTTTDARTALIEVAIERSDGQPPIKIAGEADCQAHRGTMVIDLSQLGLPGPPLDAVFDNATVYEKFPASLAAALPPGKSWVKVDLNSANGLSQGQSDPCQGVDYLRGASDKVTRVGTEDVRGTPTTHYRTVADLNAAAAKSPNGRAAIESTIKLLGSSTQPLDVWVDAQGRVRRLRYTIDLARSKAATSTSDVPGKVTSTLDLFDFGVPVQATIPPADQVTDVSALSGGH